MNKLIRTRRGFSLIELLISTAIALVIGASVILLLVQQTQLSATQNRNMINSDQMRAVLTFMEDEISMMGNGQPTTMIETANIDDFVFYTDVENDGVRDRIRYQRVNTELRRTLSRSVDGITWTVVGTDVLIADLYPNSNAQPNADPPPGLRFEYFGVNNSTTPATVNDIRAVRIYLSLNEDANTGSITRGRVAPQRMVGYATIRNRQI